MNTINLNAITTMEKMRDVAETFRVAHENSNIRVGEMEFLMADYRRAYTVATAQIETLRAQINTQRARIIELEDLVAPASDMVKLAAPAVPLQAPAEDVQVPASDAT